MTLLLPIRCATCGGNLIADEDLGPRCLACARPMVPPRVATEDPQQEPRMPRPTPQAVARMEEELELAELMGQRP